MTADIIATENKSIKVTVNDDEIFKAVCHMLGLGRVYNSRYCDDIRWVEEYDEQGNLVKLQQEQDISYHSNPCWKPTKDSITDKELLKSYVLTKELQEQLNHRKEVK